MNKRCNTGIFSTSVSSLCCTQLDLWSSRAREPFGFAWEHLPAFTWPPLRPFAKTVSAPKKGKEKQTIRKSPSERPPGVALHHQMRLDDVCRGTIGAQQNLTSAQMTLLKIHFWALASFNLRSLFCYPHIKLFAHLDSKLCLNYRNPDLY